MSALSTIPGKTGQMGGSKMIDWFLVILVILSWFFWYVFGYSLGRKELSDIERGYIDSASEDILDTIDRLRERDE